MNLAFMLWAFSLMDSSLSNFFMDAMNCIAPSWSAVNPNFVSTGVRMVHATGNTIIMNCITLKLKKVKGEYSYDHWTDLKKKGGKAAKDKSRNKDPSAGIMDMMKDLYDNGDDNMRKIIGESMMKSRNGEKQDPNDIELPQSPSIDDDDDVTEPD